MNFLKTVKGQHKDLGKIVYSEASLFPVMTADELLANASRARIVKKIEKLADVHPEDFHILYESLIRHFVEYVQVIPAFVFHKLGELMDDGLLRALMAMEACHKDHTASEDPRLTYAVFSAALLLDVAKVATQQRIMISDEDGKFIREWSPYEHVMVGHAEYYKIRFLGPGYAQMGEWVIAMIARQIMPQQAFLFIAEDYHVLQMWLAMFNGDERSARVLGEILSRIKEKFDQFKEMHRLPGLDVELEEPEAVKDGEDFLAWLKENIENGKLKINQRDAKIFMVTGGAFLDASIFQQFCETYGETFRGQRDWIVVASQFNHLGIGKKGGEDFKFDQYFSAPGESYAKRAFMGAKESSKTPYATTRKGLVVSKTDVIFSDSSKYSVDEHLKPAAESKVKGGASAKSAAKSAAKSTVKSTVKGRLVKELPKAKTPPLRTRPP